VRNDSGGRGALAKFLEKIAKSEEFVGVRHALWLIWPYALLPVAAPLLFLVLYFVPYSELPTSYKLQTTGRNLSAIIICKKTALNLSFVQRANMKTLHADEVPSANRKFDIEVPASQFELLL
jgi:hypothetical protein